MKIWISGFYGKCLATLNQQSFKGPINLSLSVVVLLLIYFTTHLLSSFILSAWLPWALIWGALFEKQYFGFIFMKTNELKTNFEVLYTNIN